MPKLESSKGSGQDSLFTIRISKRTALEIFVVICIILGFVLLRQHAKSSDSASANQQVSESIVPAPAPASTTVTESPHRPSASTERVQAKSYTPEFGADDLSNSPPPDYANQEQANQEQAEPNGSYAEPAPTPANVAYTERQDYVPSDAAPSFPDPVPAEPERNAPERNRSEDGSTKSPADTRSNPTPGPATEPTRLNGAGATFPNPLYQKWFTEFHELHLQVQINYQSIGSGGGVKQLQAGTVDFGASDISATDAQIAETPFRFMQIPTVLSAVVITYNVPGMRTIQPGLRFSPGVLADIFLGKIQNWNDPRIQQNNPWLQLPDARITVIHRSDGSGATYTLTDYLSKISPEWANLVRSGTTVSWPVGFGGKGNEGVEGLIKQTQGSIGYVDLIYAATNRLPMGSIQNAAGLFIEPSLVSVQAAAASSRIPDDFRVSITNAPGKTAYPIAGFTWLLVPQQWHDSNKERTFVAFMNWMMDRGEAIAPELGFIPLPKEVGLKAKQKIDSIQVRLSGIRNPQ
jgi:phosphate transport system substrate-binding protein